jgi:hypothetical protein
LGINYLYNVDKALLKPDSKNKFNGGSEIEEDFDVNLYSTFYRQYDPEIGRISSVDASPVYGCKGMFKK